jgi:magnesium chelatase family protein
MRLAAAREPTWIHRVAGLTGGRTALVITQPFRAPHHTVSDVGLVGGGQLPTPGEASPAHHGVLFVDELPEFRRHVFEVLRQPLEDDPSALASTGEPDLIRRHRIKVVIIKMDLGTCPTQRFGDKALVD